MAQKLYYYLIAGTIMHADKDENVGALTLNAIVSQPSKSFNVRSIAKAQQSLQMNFHGRTEDPTIKIFDVTIMAVNYLGHMSPEDFQRPAPGEELSEMKADSYAGLPN